VNEDDTNYFFSNVQLTEKKKKSKILPGDSLLGIDKSDDLSNIKSQQ
jgi:hypothetical protein